MIAPAPKVVIGTLITLLADWRLQRAKEYGKAAPDPAYLQRLEKLIQTTEVYLEVLIEGETCETENSTPPKS